MLEKDYCTEAEALSDILEAFEYDDEFFVTIRNEKLKNKIDSLKATYKTNEQAKVGDLISCPICNKQFIKRSYQNRFCGLRGKGKDKGKGHLCKDTYWNLVDDNRRFRSKYFK